MQRNLLKVTAKFRLSEKNCNLLKKNEVMASEDNKFYYLCIEYKYNNVEMIEIIKKYFPNLSDKQMEQFEMLDALYRGWA